MLDIASKVGLGDDGLENSKEDPIFNSWGVSRLAVVQPRAGTVLFQLLPQLAREGTPEPTKGMVVVRGQEGMPLLTLTVLEIPICHQACVLSFKNPVGQPP